MKALRWLTSQKRDQNVCLHMVKKGQLRSIALMKEKINFEGFTGNDCYGNQPQPFEVDFIALTPTVSALLQNKI